MRWALLAVAVSFACCSSKTPVADAGPEVDGGVIDAGQDAGLCQSDGGPCTRHLDCCSGSCTVDDGGAGRCLSVVGIGDGPCKPQGNACSDSAQCCSRLCGDPGSGVKVCLSPGGCRTTFASCGANDDCCGGGLNPNGAVTCDLGVCTSGQACNAAGNPCGAPVFPDGGALNASQNCCEGMQAVCRLDKSGLPRCFGGMTTQCPFGWTGEAGCCIGLGQRCQFREQCCDDALCLPGDAGVLRCSLPTASLDGGTELSCQQHDAACTASSDCCSGSSWVIPSGTTTGTCQPASCVSAGQSCSETGSACCAGSACLTSDLQRCDGDGGSCLCKHVF